MTTSLKALSTFFTLNTAANPPMKLAVGSQDQMLIIRFNGVDFLITGKYVKANFLPSWVLFKEPNLLYATNPLSNDTSMFRLRPNISSHSLEHEENWDNAQAADGDTSTVMKLLYNTPTFISSANGSHGGVHLEFNADKTRIVEASFSSGKIDVWDISAADGSLKLMKSLSITGKPSPGNDEHHPYQAVLDPTGRFFIIPNLTADTLLILDAKDDRYVITNISPVPNGVGPRHAAFLTSEGTHYLVLATKFTSEIFLFEAKYVADTILFTEVHRQTTYGRRRPLDPSKVAAAEIVVARNQRDIYVSNRNMGHETDVISHFRFFKSTSNS